MTKSAPAGGIRTILEDVAGFASSQYALRIGSLIKGFAVARILGPAGNGIWQHFALIFDYSQFAHLGILPGYNKVMGHRLGRGDEAGVMNARDNGLAGVFVSALVVWIGLCLYAWLGRDLDPIDRVSLPGGISALPQAYVVDERLTEGVGRCGREPQGVAHGLPLRIKNALFQHHMHGSFHHTTFS